MRDQVFIRNHIKDQLEEHVLQQFPHECCGLVAGEKMFNISAIFPLGNSSLSQDRFVIDEEEFYSVGLKVISKQLVILGIYHSHPNAEPVLSEEDIKGMTFPGISLILGITDKIEWAAYFIDREVYAPLGIVWCP